MAYVEDVPAVKPRRSSRSLGWIAVGLLVAIVLFPVAFVYWFVESGAAISEWNRLGGSINVANTDVMMFGPESRASNDEIAASLRRLRWMPGCDGLSIREFSSGDVDRMVQAFRPVELGVSDSSLNDAGLQCMAKISCLRRVKFGGDLAITASGLRQFLTERSDILIFVERSSYRQEDLDALQRDFPNRVEIWNQ